MSCRKPKHSVIVDVSVGEGTHIWDHVNLYKCRIGRNCKIHPFVYIEQDVVIGDDCKIQAFAGIGRGTRIGNRVHIGPQAIIANVKHPYVDRVEIEPSTIEDDVAIGASAVILPGITVKRGAIVGAGAVVTRDVPPHTTVVGNPAKALRKRRRT
jgi:UDP-2-acetamido-3-amino-2,3-dideoxy-glucuronate N-acetyltransferase